tara:strand:+ start:24865 stop:26808 length:1944 start_codon:yes stop_codon:yes gene_type:complete
MEFMSVENLKSLMNIIKTYFVEKQNIDPNLLNRINLKKVFFEVMSKVNTENSDQSNTYKSKLTLKIVKEIVSIELNKSLPRDASIFADRQVIINNNFQEKLNTTLGNTDVNFQMNTIATTMNDVLENEVPKLQTLDAQLEGDLLSQDEFKSKLASLENVRKSFNKDLQKIHEQKQSSVTYDRNKDMLDIVKTDVHPKEFYVNNNSIQASKEIEFSTYKNKQDEIENNKIEQQIEVSNERILVKRYLLINSFNRNWITNKHRYKYPVKFASYHKTVMRVPYYENNPTIPFTKTSTFEGIENTTGWYDDKNNVSRNPYQADAPLGQELGFETYELPVDQDATTMNLFKDIYSISITNITIPSERIHVHANTVNANVPNQFDYNYNFNFPYILCYIDEFQDIYDGTDNIIRKTFCQLQYHDYMKTPNGRGYVIFKPVQDEKKIFYPNYLSSLPTLNISLRKPNGELLDNSEDGLTVLHIAPEQNYYLKITTEKYFIRDSFSKGDYIQIKDFTLYKLLEMDSENATEINISALIDFVNKTDGHVIYEIGEPSDDGYFNSFYIYAPGTFNTDDGKFDVNQVLINLLIDFNDRINDIKEPPLTDTSVSLDVFNNYKYGKLINMSLQHSISMTVESYQHDTSVLKPVVISKYVM